MTMMLMMLACLAIWALVGLMLGDARTVLHTALLGSGDQAGHNRGGGWMPSPLTLAQAAPAASRTLRRR